MPPAFKIFEVSLFIDTKPAITSTLIASAKSLSWHEDKPPGVDRK
jgi:hypothetical protein